MRVLYVEKHAPPIHDRIAGALLGTLIGDALGRPFEGTPASDHERLARLLRRRLDAPRAFGHSDDGEMMLNLAESLLRRGELDERHVLECLAVGHEPARGYGKGTRAAFRVWAAGGTVEQAGRAAWAEGSRGNGAAVRVAALAAWAHGGSESEVVALARRSGRATHLHRDACDGAAIVAAAVHRALSSDDRSEVVVGLDPHAAGELASAARASWDLRAEPGHVAAQRLGVGVLAVQSVPAALWAFAGATDFEDALLRATGLGGDTDSIGAMTGAIAGAFHGAAGIPAGLIDALEAPAARQVRRYALAFARG